MGEEGISQDELRQTLLPKSTANDVPLNNPDTAPPPVVLSRNIPLMMWYMLFRCAPEAIWLGSVLSAYIFLIRPNNPELVGYMSAIEGITQFISACVAGVLADWYRRDVLLKLSSLVGVAAGACILWAAAHGILGPLVVGLALNGAFDGIGLTASMAIFADSIEDGRRSHYFTRRKLSTSVGQFAGPLFGLGFFLLQGDNWSVQSCARIMITAQILLLPAFVVLWLFRDVEISSAEEELLTNNGEEAEGETATAALLSTAGSEPHENLPSEANETNDQEINFDCVSKAQLIAMCCAGSDILCSVANGVSLRYFTIFFIKDLKWGPILVQCLDGLSCLLGAVLTVIAQKASLRYGRCPVSAVFKMVGITALSIMVFSYSEHKHNTSHLGIGVMYVLQNAFLNSTGALTRSLIMDHVPRQERAKWSALESINIFGWCGSAAIGGMVVKYFNGNVLPVFILTAGLQVVGSIPLVALFGIEEKEQQDERDE